MKEKKHTKSQLLLLEDVTNLGRKGDLAQAKPGFVRNYLLPQKKAVFADKRTIRMQERLKEERATQAAHDEKEAKLLAGKLKDLSLSMTVKTDTQGHLYGSVVAIDIVKLLAGEGFEIEKKNVLLPKPIKFVGLFDINLRLSEDVPATFKLKVKGDKAIEEVKTQVEVVDEGEESVEAAAEAEGEELPMRSERKKEMNAELEERSKE
ncbi:MAG: 50S ribosomal protein L9 [Chlamydiae bacterium]|nr:50S ribosomal protein L9 [Chlamydiota bacterium]